MGLYFYEAGSHPRQGLVVYDRAYSATSLLAPGDVDWERVLKECHHFHTTGITAAISAECRALMLEGLEEARRAGVSTSFDINYRSQLWGREEARRGLEPALELAEHLILSDVDCRVILSVEGADEEELARRVGKRYGCRSVALTMLRDITVDRARFQALFWDGKRTRRGRDFQLNYVGWVGGRDAFAAGYIYGILRDDLSLGLRMGSAMCALKCTMPGDMLHCSPHELAELLGGSRERPPVKR